MVEALREIKNFHVKAYNFRGSKEDVEMGAQDNPLVYYLFGSIDQPKSLVLSESDLLDFIVAIISKTPPLPPKITSEFQEKYKSFLFLGFGFRNWYLRILLHVLRGSHSRSKAFALDQIAAADDPNYQRAKIFFKDEYKLQFCTMALEEFATQLKEKYEKRVGSVSTPLSSASRSSMIPAEVFICHASEDKDHARLLSDQLTEQGFKPWLDNNTFAKM